MTGEKLVVLTADRPVELVGCGANQAINQLGIFAEHVSDSLNLPSPTLSTPLNWLLTSVDEVMFTQRLRGSAVHINCAFPEPLYSNTERVRTKATWTRLQVGETAKSRIVSDLTLKPAVRSQVAAITKAW